MLLERLRADLATAAALPAQHLPDLRPEPKTLRWLRARTNNPVYATDFEQDVDRRLGPDPFARRRPGPPARSTGDIGAALADLTRTGSEGPGAGEAVGLLRRIGLTAAPRDAEKPPHISSVDRSPTDRRWGHRMGAPQLPSRTQIPRTLHLVQLGGPIRADAPVRQQVAQVLAGCAGQIDIMVWTDLTRAQAEAAAAGASGSWAEAVRATLHWARTTGITLVGIEEVFHAGAPMVLGQEYAAERSGRDCRGSAEASQYLGLDILLRFGGAWAAVGTQVSAALAPAGSVVGQSVSVGSEARDRDLFDAVAASLPGFTLDRDSSDRPRGRLVLAPAGHPAIRLWQELVRVSYTLREDQLAGGLAAMVRPDPVAAGSRRSAWVLTRLVERLGAVGAELVRPPRSMVPEPNVEIPDSVDVVHDSGDVVPAPTVMGPESTEDTARVLGDLLTAGLLRTRGRSGNLHLVALEPVIRSCPEPDAAWIALVSLWSDLVAAGRVEAITSITDAHRGESGQVHQVRLPPQVRAGFDHRPVPGGWFGADLPGERPGRPVWLLGERVVPARFLAPVRRKRRQGALSPAQLAFERSAVLAQARRSSAAGELLERIELLRAQDDPDGPAASPQVHPAGQVQDWVRRLTGLAVGTTEFENGLRGRLGVDVFGRWSRPRQIRADRARRVAELIAVTGTFDIAHVVPDRVAPVLRSLSLTRCGAAESAADLERLQRPAPITRSRRGDDPTRTWSPDPTAPGLPEPVLLPRVAHAIWLGGPRPDRAFTRSLAALARAYAGRLDVVLWTDIDRDAARSALTGGTAGQAAQITATLNWARANRISVLDWREVFDEGHPALAHEQILAEQLITSGAGSSAASAALRLEILARYGGIYLDGDLDLVGTERQRPDLVALLDETAESQAGFAADTRVGGHGVRQVIIAPARHPAIVLWQEILRLTTALREWQLFGGAEPMSERYAACRAQRQWRRDPETFRIHRAASTLARWTGDAGAVQILTEPRPGHRWVRTRPVAVPDPGGEAMLHRVQEILIVLLRQLEVRSGDLHLTRVAPLVARTPVPDVVWIAVLRFLAEAAEQGRIPVVTSVTRFRWSDQGEPEYVELPPEAEALLEYGPPARTWFGAGLAVADAPVWVLDEFVVPASLGQIPSAQCGIGDLGTPEPGAGLRVPDGVAGVTLTGRSGVLWHNDRRVRPQDVAGWLSATGRLGQPVWLRVDAEPQHGAAHFADRLAALLGVEVALLDRQARPGRRARRPADPCTDPRIRDPQVLLSGLDARANAAGPSRWAPVPAPPPMLEWLRALIDERLYHGDFEAEGERVNGPDLFGLTDRLLGTTAGPRPGDGVLGELAGAGADLVAPLLRRLSLSAPSTRPESLAQALAAVRSASVRGRVSRRDLDPVERCWGHPQAPVLPEQIAIPHVLHGIWLGGPVPEEGVYRRNLGAGADRWSGQVDVVLWTDLTRAQVARAQAGGGDARDEQIRSTLHWARRHSIALVNLFEVFGPADPLVCGREFVREYVKDVPRGYAAASDILRLEIVAAFGGVYTDGDNSFDAADLAPLPDLFDQIAASEPKFTLDYLGHGRINNDIVAGPAAHPAWRVFLETTRVNFRRSQRNLLGGPERMSQHFAGQQVELMRYTTVRRTGRCHHLALHRLGYDAQDPRPVHPGRMIRHGSELSWGRPPAPAPVRTCADVLDRLERVVTTLARNLVNRDGDLYLTEVAPVVQALPDPDAAWTTVLRFLARAQADGRVARVRSVTDVRRDNDDVVRHVLLPPAAQACLHLLRPEQVEGPWLGEGARISGAAVWLQDELVTPAVLLAPDQEPAPRASTLARPITDRESAVVGLDLTDAGSGSAAEVGDRTASADVRVAVPTGWTGVRMTARWGEPVLAGSGVREEELLDALRTWPELTGRPLMLLPTAGSGGLGAFAERLAAVSGYPVTVVGRRSEPSRPNVRIRP